MKILNQARDFYLSVANKGQNSGHFLSLQLSDQNYERKKPMKQIVYALQCVYSVSLSHCLTSLKYIR